MNSGAILTKGKGEFKLHLDKSNLTATYELTYSDLTSTASMAHIHFGKVHVPGSIMIWLCQTTIEPGPAGTPTCPEPGGTVTGTITASSVQAIPTQNVTAGDFDALVAALESNTAYANIHSVNFGDGRTPRASPSHRRKAIPLKETYNDLDQMGLALRIAIGPKSLRGRG